VYFRYEIRCIRLVISTNIGGVLGISTGAIKDIRKGDRTLAKWSHNDHYYHCTIAEVDVANARCLVDWDDGDECDR
jgi:hypothetical protein